MKATFLSLFVLAAPGLFAQGAMSAEDYLRKVDANQSFKSIEYSGRMEIVIGGETRVKTMHAWALGKEKAFIEFTNPEDSGTRMLKLDKDLWMYFPKEADTVRISGHLLKQGMMGSDMSYEDALESDALGNDYEASLRGNEAVDGRPCVVVELKAKKPSAKYDRRVIWIDSERFITMKSEMYAKSGKLLKESVTLAVDRFGGRWYPVRTEMADKLRKNTKTVIVLESLKLDVAIDAARFTRTALEE